uniref:Uncharacterized protein n=1 Tax=Candidatus Kentrum sp. FM TaxID=2126340 RepID=A0A450VRJ3_9GAMM|nr:MAG: hypothetical protein BECKFM1743A_GA0114220_100292 [Candidatus Kentron sp. FM]VFJ45950.1 MAG: hypothetical protein BECKFM1743C_GA0114222_100322 [Candidatus Kentron sp. FM]VFK07392.1 MAG: hypothetical protein BECKFM1743B_GA0114221_100402 [Candidatus Kentron sp. FM]
MSEKHLTPTQIEFLKRKAKELCRKDPTLSHNQALDLLAKEHGCNNWSILAKHHRPTSYPGLRFQRGTEDMRQALRVVGPPENPYRDTESRLDRAFRQVDDICESFVSAENAVTYAIDYVTTLLTVPRFHMYSASVVYHEMRCWLPYCAHPTETDNRILVNRYYKPVGRKSREWVDYGDFKHLILKLDADRLKEFSHDGTSESYLFYDGNPPWHSRKHAEGYLERLKILLHVMKH